MPQVIDFRSDTVTLPPPEMRRAMYEAELGDDVWGEDPTVNTLQERAAALLGKEAGLFVSSGTMGNLIAILVHCRRGDEILVGDHSHIFNHEGGGSAALGGVAFHPLPTLADGSLSLDALRAARRDPGDSHNARTALICLENTCNARGGVCLAPPYLAQVRALARDLSLPVHVDGARIFNAAVSLGVPVADLARDADSITFCFSKGLAAPIGSMLCGPRGLVEEARRWRKVLGGGMRQVGVLAAAGLYALDHMVTRLAEDHENARRLAAGLAEIEGLRLAQSGVETNIVYVDVSGMGMPATDFVRRLTAAGVLSGESSPSLVRFVTHYGIDRHDVDSAITTTQHVFGGVPA
jgi:threonine aldolase